MNDTELMKIIREAIAQATQGEAASKCECKCECDGEVDDISAYSLREEFNIPNPYNKEEYMRLKQKPTHVLAFGEQAPVLLPELLFVSAQTTLLQWTQFSTMFMKNILKETTLKLIRPNATAKKPILPDLTLAVYLMMKLLQKSKQNASMILTYRS